MKLEETSLSGLYVITPEAIVDNRGFFAELYHGQKYAAQGLDFGATRFAQQNVSVSRKNVIRGLHFQWDPPLGKMVRVTYGRTFSVAVDIRKKSQTFGRYFSIELSRENKLSLYAPPGGVWSLLTRRLRCNIYTLFVAMPTPSRASGGAIRR